MTSLSLNLLMIVIGANAPTIAMAVSAIVLPPIAKFIEESEQIAKSGRFTRGISLGRLRYSMPFSQSQIDWLVGEHNRLRAQVPASNMERVEWDSNLAYKAQRHANRCSFTHNPDRDIDEGENLYAAPYNRWQEAVSMWFNETYNWGCGCQNSYKFCCGHYTQLVWATTNRIGCGFAGCGNVAYAPGQQFVLICTYTPAGNLVVRDRRGLTESLQAFRYRAESEAPCSACPDHASRCYEDLCCP